MKIVKMLNKPKNIYFCLVAMLTLVLSLANISFSYVEKTNPEGKLILSEVDNRIDCLEYRNCEISLLPNQTIVTPVYVMSNNNFEADFILYTNDLISVKSLDEIVRTIKPRSVLKYNLEITNEEEIEKVIKLNIKSGYKDSNIEVEGTIIK